MHGRWRRAAQQPAPGVCLWSCQGSFPEQFIQRSYDDKLLCLLDDFVFKGRALEAARTCFRGREWDASFSFLAPFLSSSNKSRKSWPGIWNTGLIYRPYSDFVICHILATLSISQTLHGQVWVSVQNSQVGGQTKKKELGFAVMWLHLSPYYGGWS